MLFMTMISLVVTIFFCCYQEIVYVDLSHTLKVVSESMENVLSDPEALASDTRSLQQQFTTNAFSDSGVLQESSTGVALGR